ADADGDGFDNDLENALGSDPFDAASTPESLSEGGTCTDGIDNDGDGLVDAQDLGCQQGSAPQLQAIIDNGVVQLGVNPQGHLNVLGDNPSSGTRTDYVGLR